MLHRNTLVELIDLVNRIRLFEKEKKTALSKVSTSMPPGTTARSSCTLTSHTPYKGISFASRQFPRLLQREIIFTSTSCLSAGQHCHSVKLPVLPHLDLILTEDQVIAKKTLGDVEGYQYI